MNDSKPDLETCIYDPVPHECDHAIDDAEYHAETGKPDCGHFARGVEWTAVEALQAARRAVAAIDHGEGSTERVLGRKSMQTEVSLVIDALQKQAERGVEWTVKS